MKVSCELIPAILLFQPDGVSLPRQWLHSPFPLPRSFPSQLPFFFAILQKWLNIPHNMCPAAEYTILRNFQKKFFGWGSNSVTPNYVREGMKKQGGHGLWKTGKMMKKIPCVEKSGNLIKLRKLGENQGILQSLFQKVDYWWFLFL